MPPLRAHWHETDIRLGMHALSVRSAFQGIRIGSKQARQPFLLKRCRHKHSFKLRNFKTSDKTSGTAVNTRITEGFYIDVPGVLRGFSCRKGADQRWADTPSFAHPCCSPVVFGCGVDCTVAIAFPEFGAMPSPACPAGCCIWDIMVGTSFLAVEILV